MDTQALPTERYRNLYARAMTGKAPKAAIKCFCAMCMGWSLEEAKRCTAPACPLFRYFPGVSRPQKRTEPGKTPPQLAKFAFRGKAR